MFYLLTYLPQNTNNCSVNLVLTVEFSVDCSVWFWIYNDIFITNVLCYVLGQSETKWLLKQRTQPDILLQSRRAQSSKTNGRNHAGSS